MTRPVTTRTWMTRLERDLSARVPEPGPARDSALSAAAALERGRSAWRRGSPDWRPYLVEALGRLDGVTLTFAGDAALTELVWRVEDSACGPGRE